ncbi:MAG: hypothetical protein AB7O50_14220 [Pseudolabrys sp.]
MTRIRLLSVAWGDEFIGRLLDVTFRSLVAPGNLKDIAARYPVEYQLITPEDSVARISAHPMFAKLSEAVSFQFRPFSLKAIDPGNSMSHWTLWREAIAEARRDDVCVVLVAADHILARGALMRWVELLEEGHVAVFSPGFQVVDETAMAELSERFPASGPIDLAPPAMHEFMLRHLHPIKVSMLRGAPRAIAHREWDLRSVRGKGLSQMVLAAHPMAFRPAQVRLSENFSPLENFDRVAFEPCWFLGTEPLFKYVGLYLRPQPMNDAMLSCYGSWADIFTQPVNEREATQSHLYVHGGAATEAEVRRNRHGAEFFLRQLLTSRTLFRIWRRLKQAGHVEAARWLAAGAVHGRLRRRMTLRGPLTVVVPAEALLERLTAEARTKLLDGRGEALVAAIGNHVLSGCPPMRRGQRVAESSGGAIRSAAAKTYSLVQDGGARVLDVLPAVDGIEICIVDSLLSPLALDPVRADTGRGLRRWARHLLERTTRRSKDLILSIAARHQGLYRYVVGVRQRMLDSGRPTAPVSVDPRAVELLRRALAARGLAALDDLLRFYNTEVFSGASGGHATPARLGAIAEPAPDEVMAWLSHAVERAPEFFEAWLELGYARLESGDQAGALAAFARAKDLQPTLPPAPGQPNPRFQALLEWSELAARTGGALQPIVPVSSEATNALPWRWHVRHGQLLLAAGRADDARMAFERALQWSPIETRFTGYLPRDLTDVAELLKPASATTA